MKNNKKNSLGNNSGSQPPKGNSSRKEFTAIILAAGKGKRMKSSSPKVLHDLMGKPLIYYVLRELLSLKKYVKQIIVVVGYKGKTVEDEIKKYFFIKGAELKSGGTKIKFVYQTRMLGTANAVEVAGKEIKYNNVLVVCGDVPLITSKTLSLFISSSVKEKLSCCVLSADIEGKNTLGAILYDEKGRLQAIREKVGSVGSANAVKRDSRRKSGVEEINSGIYCFERGFLLKSLPKIKKNKDKGEYFLTDIVEIFYKEGVRLDSYFLDNSREILGINTRKDFRVAEKVMRERILDRFIEEGVRVIDPETTFIQEDVIIGKNSVIYPFTFIEKGVIIGGNCFLGPFIHLREGISVGDNTHLGNFLEINRSKTGKNVKIKHFGYLGDTTIEDNVNIGAGTIAANFDGRVKNKTYIRKGAFIGSNTVLVAPVEVGEEAVIGAGSVVTKNIRPHAVVGVPAQLLRKTKNKKIKNKETKE